MILSLFREFAFCSFIGELKQLIVESSFWLKRIGVITRLVFAFALVATAIQSQAQNLSEQAEISVVTCSPGNEAYSVYGHSAFRVKDKANNYDVVFNYGIFDFSSSNFLYRFAKGQTDYKLDDCSLDSFVVGYKKNNRSIYEQVLDLSQAEKQKIFDFLIWNAKPENRVYRYNFFFDNCATRIRDVLANNIEGGLTFNEKKHSHKTLRELVDDCHGKLLWLTFGIDLVVSSESDREATFWEEMLLPDYLMNHLAEAVKTNGTTPIVKKMTTIYQSSGGDYKSSKFFSPFVVFLVCALLFAFVSYKQFRRSEMKNGLDYLIYGITGVMGVVMAWMALFSEHPAMSPNYNLLWALPVNLLFAIALRVKKWSPFVKYYHVFISIWLILFICCSPFIPQRFHPAFYLLIVMILSRSLFHSLLFLKERSLKSQP